MKTTICCEYCNREIPNKGGLKVHEQSCESNPNRIKRSRSPLAGAKRGSVPWNLGKKTGRLKCWEDKFPDEIVFSENSKYPRHSLKARILDKNLMDYVCAICESPPFWRGKPMPLILDHINGINDDHRKLNLRFVCSNCDTQLPTYKSKNKKKKKSMEE